MTAAVVVGLLSAAAAYRLVFTVRRTRTAWRTSFTLCVVGAALAAALIYYGDPVDQVVHLWNVSRLALHLVLIVTAAAAMVYVATLNGRSTSRALRGPVLAASVAGALQVVSWVAAPVHDRPLPDFISLVRHLSVTVYEVSFIAMLLTATLTTGHFCLTRAASRHDLTRTISLALTGSSCVAASAVFTAYGVALVVSYDDPQQGARILAVSDQFQPVVLVALALGTLTLLVAPWALQFLTAYATWRSLRPLWLDLVDRYPQVHLDLTPSGTPLHRLQVRVQRAVVESYDALRLVPVPLTPRAGVEELGRALHDPAGAATCTAVEVLGTGPASADGTERILELARAYARNRT